MKADFKKWIEEKEKGFVLGIMLKAKYRYNLVNQFAADFAKEEYRRGREERFWEMVKEYDLPIQKT